jgi:hypothetical protein
LSSTPASPAATALRQSISGKRRRTAETSETELLPRVRELLVEHRIGRSSGFTPRVEVPPAGLEMAVYCVAMGQIERDRAIHLHETQYWESLGNALGRLTRKEGVDNRVEGHNPDPS